MIRLAAAQAARCKSPGDGWSLFDVRHEFPNAWELFRRCYAREDRRRELVVHLDRELFPFLPRNPEIRLANVALVFETYSHAPSPDDRRPDPGPCPTRAADAKHRVQFEMRVDGRCDEEKRFFDCYAQADEGHVYSGHVDVERASIQRGRERLELCFGLPRDAGDIHRIFLLCRYERKDECCTPEKGAKIHVAAVASQPTGRLVERTD